MKYTNEHEMKINDSKTKAILFNNAVKSDFFPNLTLNDTPLEVVEEIRLLGVMVSSDLSWRSNTSTMCQKAYSRLWMLRRLKPLGASVDDLLDVYEKQIRCLLEFACAVWTPGISKDEINQIERVQKAAFSIILAKNYKNYENALTVLESDTLMDRRNQLNLKFAKKAFKSEKYNHWFCKSEPTLQQNKTRSIIPELIPVKARTQAFSKSPISYLTNLMNVSLRNWTCKANADNQSKCKVRIIGAEAIYCIHEHQFIVGWLQMFLTLLLVEIYHYYYYNYDVTAN